MTGKKDNKHDYGSHRDGHRKRGRLVGGTPGYIVGALIVAIVALCMDIYNWEPSFNSNVTGVVETWIELTAQIADNSSGWFVDLTARPPRPRIAIAMSGGGFRAMTASMAVARGLATAGWAGSNAWSDVTHVSSVSGGSWFSSQFVYSGTFYRQVTGTSVGIEKVVEDWGIEYTTAMRASIRSGSLRTLDPAADANVCSGSCTDTRRLIALALDFIQRLTENPLIEWEPWVGTFLGQYIANTFPVSNSSATYVDAPRNGLSSATLIQGLVFPPDAFTPGTAAGARATLVCDTEDAQDGLNQRLNSSTVPLGYVAPGPDTAFSGFNVPPEVRAFNLSVNGQLHTLRLPEKPRISTITGASSAALGPVASPSMLQFVADTLAKTTPLSEAQEELLRTTISSSFAEGGLVEDCLPQVARPRRARALRTPLSFTIGRP